MCVLTSLIGPFSWNFSDVGIFLLSYYFLRKEHSIIMLEPKQFINHHIFCFYTTQHYPGLVQALQSKLGLSTQTFHFSYMIVIQMFSTREHWVLVKVPRAETHRIVHHSPGGGYGCPFDC
jgi:hypothetical protein